MLPQRGRRSIHKKPVPARVPAFVASRVFSIQWPLQTLGLKCGCRPGLNHKFGALGTGAYAGRISYGPLENAVAPGYAAAVHTDTRQRAESSSDIRAH
jgi:hypothetical protein